MAKQQHHITIHLTDAAFNVMQERAKAFRSVNAYIAHCIEVESGSSAAANGDAQQIAAAARKLILLAAPEVLQPHKKE